MVTKLIKHEFLRTRSALALIFGAAAATVALSALVVWLQWPFITTLGSVTGMFAAIAVFPGAQFYLAYDYWKSSYSGSGYLTQTLPVAGGTIYRAKLLWGGIVSLVAVLVVAILGMLFALASADFLGTTPGALWNGVWETIGTAISTMPWWASLGIIVFGLICVVTWLIQLQWAISVGSQEPMNRFGFGGVVLAFIALYFAQQVLFMVSILGVPFGIEVAGDASRIVSINWLSLINTANPDAIPIGFIPVFILLPILLVGWTRHSWNNSVSLR